MLFRELRPDEYEKLKDFLYGAIYVPEGIDPPERSIIELPELSVYYIDFGSRRADQAIAAVDDGAIIGVIWSRIMDDYGHIDNDTPSLAMSVVEDCRGQGTGTMLLKKMLDLLAEEGYSRVSLSVQKANPAIHLYERAGFRTEKENDEEYIMTCSLQDRWRQKE